MKHQHNCLLELRQHLRCGTHSLPGRPVYCWPEPGGYHKLTHEEMTLWAKYIVSKMTLRKVKKILTVDVQSIGKATKFLPPKIQKYDHPPAKKPKSRIVKPEVLIALNFATTPGAGLLMYAVHVQPIKPSPLGHTPGQTPPAGVSDIPVHTFNIVPAPEEMLPVGCSNTPVHTMPPGPMPMPPTQPSPIHVSRMRIILDCQDASTVPSLLDLLTLMDQDCLTPVGKYVDPVSEFYDFGVEDIIDVFGMPCGILASLRDIGSERAHQLHEYARDKLLLPLDLLETGMKLEAKVKELISKGGDSSIVEV